MSCLSKDSHIKVDFSPKIKATRAKYSFSPSFLILSARNLFHSSPVSANKAPGKHWIKDGQCFRSTQESEDSEGISHEFIMIAASAIQLERRYRGYLLWSGPHSCSGYLGMNMGPGGSVPGHQPPCQGPSAADLKSDKHIPSFKCHPMLQGELYKHPLPITPPPGHHFQLHWEKN